MTNICIMLLRGIGVFDRSAVEPTDELARGVTAVVAIVAVPVENSVRRGDSAV